MSSAQETYDDMYIGAWRQGVKRFPLHNEIAVPVTNGTENGHTSGVTIPIVCRIKIDPSDVTHVNYGFENDEQNADTDSDHSTRGSSTSPSIETSILTSYPVNPFSSNPNLASDIEAEWKHLNAGHQTISGPISIISGFDSRSGTHVTKQPSPTSRGSQRNPDQQTNSTPQGNQSSGEKGNAPYPLQYFLSVPSSSVDDCQIFPNPYNTINHKFHSALQCPCFLYFFFICCLPGIQFMQISDIKFKKSDKARAKKFGRLSTVCLIIGSIVGVVFLSISIFFAGQYVKQYMSSNGYS